MKAFCLLLLCVSLVSQASGEKAVRKTVEATMHVVGQVVISAQGRVESYRVGEESLPPEVARLVARFLPACQFAVTPASGKPGPVKAGVALQIVARQTSDGRVVVAVKDYLFQDPDTPRYITEKEMRPPDYPAGAVLSGLSGTVYVALRLNPDGTVAEAHAEQVNMTVVAREKTLERGRGLLAKAALAKARKWTFNIDERWHRQPGPISVRVPVDFRLAEASGGKTSKNHPQWQAYVPGPYSPIPWESAQVADGGVGAMTPGQLYPVGSAIRLKAPVGI